MAILAFKQTYMACGSTSPVAPQCASADNPVDLVHLSKQSLGNRSLEQEILALFKSQSVLYLDRLKHATTTYERKMAAHTILGSARGVGAWKVAAEAEQIQAHCAMVKDLTQLEIRVAEANDYITELLS